MELTKLSDEALEKSLVGFIQKERSLLCVIILHVMEIERRKNYLKSHPSLMAYLKETSKYTHGSAQRRIDAALLALEIPSILKDVNSGEINQSQIILLNSAFRQSAKENKIKVSTEVKQAILNSIKEKTVEESEVIVYGRLNIKPKTKVKVKRQGDGSVRVEQTFTKEEWALIERAKELLSHSVPSNNLNDLFVYMSKRVIAHKDKTLPKPARGQDATVKAESLTPTQSKGPSIPSGISNSAEVTRDGRIQPQSRIQTHSSKSEQFTNHTTKDESKIPSGISETAEGTGNGRTQSQSKIPSGISSANAVSGEAKLSAEQKITSKGFVQTWKRPQGRKPLKISVEKQVFRRDECCQYKTGDKICGSKWQLQVDHIEPVWSGGKDDVENLRILCGAHNRYAYRAQSGVRSV